MPVNPADLRGMLRADALGLVLGLLLKLTGLAALVVGSVLRAREVSLLWLGASSLLYGSRLVERAAILRLPFDALTFRACLDSNAMRVPLAWLDSSTG